MKTTGVSGIPKFGLLDFLGHPSGHKLNFCAFRHILLDIISPCVNELEYLMLRCAESWLAPHRI